ncbi:class I SAM-dependent methyltransferase [Streptomyces zagrosensis]|uniref:Ubiquinone/menaquinone biosynthesis C-methylase UbiE n=1 Tax=Streptomyces zagrosensis TaxID=1042984 RepID=A0A7W9QF55_9ACTN|nr:methyltransferase domain-containing protein [Streptomyces zagrosensis]MBB5938563.1 ubiquinone/menaquinone biosynthesis C-methylase UbiE [Streptomyces zagrosensis]
MSQWQHRFAHAPTDRVRLYDQVLAPAVFHPWACYLAGAIGPCTGAQALDVACGTGTLTRVLATSIGSEGSVTGTDISDGMLGAARGTAPALGAPQRYLQSPAAPLDQIDDGRFDLTCCQHGLQFFPDRPAAAREWHRVTKPGGTLAVAIWAPLEHNPLFDALHHAVAVTLSADYAEKFAHPWSLPAPQARAVIEEAGFTHVRHHRALLPTTFPGGAKDLLTVYQFSPIADVITGLDLHARRHLEQAVDHRLAPFQDETAITAPTSVEIIVATR